MKKLASLLLFMAFSTMIVHAQDIQITAEFKEIANIRQQNNGKFSLNNEQNKPIITDIDSIFSTSNVFYHVIKNGKHGIYYKSGKQCIPIEYDDIERLYTNYWLTTKDGKVGLCWSNGNQIFPTNYKDISILRREEYGKYDFFIVKKDKYTILNSHGKAIFPTQYDEIRQHNDYYILENSSGTDCLFNSGELVKGILIDYYVAPFLHQENGQTKKYYDFKKDNLWGIIDGDGRIHIPALYQEHLRFVYNCNENLSLCLVANYKGKRGIINFKNEIVLPFKYNRIMETEIRNIFEIETTKGLQLFNLQSKRIITPSYYENCTSDTNYIYLSKAHFKTPFDPQKEQIILPWEYSTVYNIPGSHNFAVKKDGLFGVVNSENKVLVPFIYEDMISTNRPNMLVITKNNQYGIIDINNKLLYGMTDNRIEVHRDYFELKVPKTNKTIQKLDYNLKEIK
ncbi:WG repeat-containing protein [Prevotella salivae]|uniref:WG repeat-containing protein n=1 Tax=Segatella salivae TaxID=228604 RepID=A0AAW4NQH2_9BACT|nr:WG repeat-containing protein [Segatella salivae]MBW4864841.1 WG repeat-containing protein [Segatella salivae]MBW4908749.1 WG repeat-containing protein [Segatella salivae]